ncbi:MAG: DNA repair protein RecN [Thermodesulfobacteriota bacterium]
MLQELAIKNFAIIDDLRISFGKGLTILSGETGAGKSIIINAVNLLLGSRATARLIRTGETSAEVEAVFDVAKDSALARRLDAHGFDCDGQLIIRRVVADTNKNRIYINGGAATIQVLSDITASLASISGQHAHQQLLNEDLHLLVLDAFAGLAGPREEVSKAFASLVPLLRELDTLKARQADQARQKELLAFQKDEIEKANVTPGEDESLEREKKRLKNAQELYALIFGCIEGLYDAQGAVIEQLALVRTSLENAARIDDTLNSHRQMLADIEARTADATEGLRAYLNTIDTDGSALNQVEERLDLIVRLKKKYGPALADVLARLTQISVELTGLENLSGRIAEVESAVTEAHQKLARAATTLSAKRKKAAPAFCRAIEAELAGLKMEGTRFDVVFSTVAADEKTSPFLVADGCVITEAGIDRAAFSIAPNVGETAKPLAAIASGGELSRVVLAIKALLAGKESVETLVFDEVDAGIGGETAEVVGKKLVALSRFHQTLCITHLPQIAKFGDTHYRIEKHVKDGRTVTRMVRLSREDRIQELARMTGGKKITEKTVAHAREMLESAGSAKND